MRARRLTQNALNALMRDRLLLLQLKRIAAPAPAREFRFYPPRRWRFDYAWPDARVALEVEGGVWTRGRHVRPAGYLKDMEKYNRAAIEGWRVLRVVPQQIDSGAAVTMLGNVLGVDRG